MATPRPRILVIQPSLQPPGGGNGVCAWMLQALRDDHALTLLTWRPIDLDAVNRFFGTSLRASDVEWLTVSPVWRAALDRLPVRAVRLKSSVLRRRAKGLRGGFDLMMSASNEADFGRAGIQYVHYPVRRVPASPSSLRWYHSRWALALYEGLCALVSPFDEAAMRANVTLVNSAWTGDLVTRTHGIRVRVVHPPAAGAFAPVPWAERDDGFLCIGRVSPEKNVERVIAIVERVRATRPSARLHIVGEPEHRAYARRVAELARRAGPWVTLHGVLPMDALERLMSTQRYVIHGMREEHFGMGIAQALRAGCIPFVPDGGGQVEIVGDEPLVRYRSTDDAVDKIVNMMVDGDRQRQIRARLADRATRFGAGRFMQAIRDVVAEALATAEGVAPRR